MWSVHSRTDNKKCNNVYSISLETLEINIYYLYILEETNNSNGCFPKNNSEDSLLHFESIAQFGEETFQMITRTMVCSSIFTRFDVHFSNMFLQACQGNLEGWHSLEFSPPQTLVKVSLLSLWGGKNTKRTLSFSKAQKADFH